MAVTGFEAWLTASVAGNPPDGFLPAIDALAGDDTNTPTTTADDAVNELHLRGLTWLPAGALLEVRTRLRLLETGVGSSLNPAIVTLDFGDGDIQRSRIIVARLDGASGAGVLTPGSAPGAVVRHR